MKMSTLACMRVAGFAAGLIAGAVLSQLRWSTGAAHAREPAARHRTVEKGTLPRAEPDRRTEADRQEAPQPPAKTSSKRQQHHGDTAADKAPGHRRGKEGQRGIQGLTKQQLYHEARKRNIRGRSTMTKAELQRALR